MPIICIMVDIKCVHFVLGDNMKQVIVLAVSCLVSSFTFAAKQPLDALNSALRTPHPSTSASLKDPKDITMGYGGEDVSRRPSIATHTITL
jgi:hypothetical protein